MGNEVEVVNHSERNGNPAQAPQGGGGTEVTPNTMWNETGTRRKRHWEEPEPSNLPRPAIPPNGRQLREAQRERGRGPSDVCEVW